MPKYEIIKTDWFDYEDTTVGTYDSLEEAQKALESYRQIEALSTGNKDHYYLYEVPSDGHSPKSFAEFLGMD